MTKEEIIKGLESAFAKYIITASEKGATVSDRCEDAIKLDKYDQIEQIVNRELIAGERNYKSCYKAFFEIVDAIQR